MRRSRAQFEMEEDDWAMTADGRMDSESESMSENEQQSNQQPIKSATKQSNNQSRKLLSEASSIRKFVDVDDLGAAYAGKKVTRKQLEPSFNQPENQSDEEVEYDLSDDAESEDDEDNLDDFDSEDDQTNDHSEDDFDNENSNDESDDEQNEDSDSIKAQLAAEMQSLKANTASVFAPVNKAVKQSNHDKATAILRQRSEYEEAFNWRIRLQTAIDAGNRLPACEPAMLIDVSDNQTKAFTAVFDLMETLMKLQESRSTDQSLPVWDRSAIKRRKLDNQSVIIDMDDAYTQYSSHLDQLSSQSVDHRNNVLSKWHDRTLAAAGLTVGSTTSMLAKPIVEQIDDILSNKTKLLRRTRLNRSNGELIGARNSNQVQNVDQSQDADGTFTRQIYDDDIFDDTDWYNQQLHDLSSSISQSSLITEAHLQTKRKRQVKQVDRKASKGRKIRYTIEPKLANFMAPVAFAPTQEIAVDALVSSLFGKKV